MRALWLVNQLCRFYCAGKLMEKSRVFWTIILNIMSSRFLSRIEIESE